MSRHWRNDRSWISKMSSKRKRPVSSSKKMQPKDQMSAALEMFQGELRFSMIFAFGICWCHFAVALLVPTRFRRSCALESRRLTSAFWRLRARKTTAVAMARRRSFSLQGTKSNSNISGPWEAEFLEAFGSTLDPVFLTLMISVPLFRMSSSWAFWRKGITNSSCKHNLSYSYMIYTLYDMVDRTTEPQNPKTFKSCSLYIVCTQLPLPYLHDPRLAKVPKGNAWYIT